MNQKEGHYKLFSHDCIEGRRLGFALRSSKENSEENFLLHLSTVRSTFLNIQSFLARSIYYKKN